VILVVGGHREGSKVHTPVDLSLLNGIRSGLVKEPKKHLCSVRFLVLIWGPKLLF